MQKIIKTYDELKSWVSVFNQGALDIFIVEGSAGAGKSSIVRQSLANTPVDQFCWIEGRITAVCLYEKLFQFRDHPIIIDDVDGLYRDKDAVNLLKCLCQTWTEKTVTWQTKSIRKEKDIPDEFKTKSKVLIITNSWKSLNKHVGAVQDRGLLGIFHPDAREIHDYVKVQLGNNPEIFDEEIYHFIEENLGIIAEPSVRHYRNALQLKNVGMPWKEVLIESFGLTKNQMSVLKLCSILDLSHNQRAEMFAKENKLSERTYWRTKSDLEERGINLTKE